MGYNVSLKILEDMMSDSPAQEVSNAEISFKQIFLIFWNRKLLIILITSVISIFTIFYSLSLPNEYRATAILSESLEDKSSLASGASGQSNVGGLASLAGISLDTGSSSEADHAIQIMKSWGFIDNLISENNLQIPLMATVGWNLESNSPIIDDDVYSLETKSWLRPPTPIRTSEPTSWEMYKAFSDRAEVRKDRKTGLISVSFDYFSPIKAQYYADLYVRSINQYMRSRQISQSKKNIEYLTEEIGKTSISEMRSLFYRLISDQTKKLMLAQATPEYVFTTLSETMVPEIKHTPIRSRMVILAFIIGILLSFFIVIVLDRSKFTIKDNK